MIPIIYKFGDATRPEGDGTKYIVHCCNDIGLWGAGFVLSLSRRWPETRTAYCNLRKFELTLGHVQFVRVEPDIIVANIIGQHGVWRHNDQRHTNIPPIRYEAIAAGLRRVAKKAEWDVGMSVHMPRIGCGRAGGQWEKMEPIIAETLSVHDIPVTVYDLPC